MSVPHTCHIMRICHILRQRCAGESLAETENVTAPPSRFENDQQHYASWKPASSSSDTGSREDKQLQSTISLSTSGYCQSNGVPWREPQRLKDTCNALVAPTSNSHPDCKTLPFPSDEVCSTEQDKVAQGSRTSERLGARPSNRLRLSSHDPHRRDQTSWRPGTTQQVFHTLGKSNQEADRKWTRIRQFYTAWPMADPAMHTPSSMNVHVSADIAHGVVPAFDYYQPTYHPDQILRPNPDRERAVTYSSHDGHPPRSNFEVEEFLCYSQVRLAQIHGGWRKPNSSAYHRPRFGHVVHTMPRGTSLKPGVQPDSSRCRPKIPRSHRLPKKSIQTMKAWFHENITHPYPSEQQKVMLSELAAISMTQVRDWFVNYRRRYLTRSWRRPGCHSLLVQDQTSAGTPKDQVAPSKA